jgi:hypothetical protein
MPLGFDLAEYHATVCRVPYSDRDWAAIVALLPKRPEAKVEARFRFDIESSAYLVKSGSGYKTKTEWMAAWKKVASASVVLRDALAVVMEEEIQVWIDKQCSHWINEAEVKIRSLRATSQPRKDRPAVKQVVGQLLDLWSHCGGKLTLTIAKGDSDEGYPKGKLIEFLKTATNPIFLAKPLSNNTLAHLIIRRRKADEIDAAEIKRRGEEDFG